MLILDRYQYDPSRDQLGEGGFSSVYKAIDTKFDVPVALKLLHPGSNQRYDLKHEILRAIGFNHPNLCRYIEYGEIDDPYRSSSYVTQVCILEYIDGKPIDIYLKSKNEAEKAILLPKLLIEVLNGLDYLHDKNIIHRDVKEDNILVEESKHGPVPKLIDFILARKKAALTVLLLQQHLVIQHLKVSYQKNLA